MKSIWIIPVLASILILGTLGFSQYAEATPPLIATATVPFFGCCGIDDLDVDSSGNVYVAQFGGIVSKFTSFPTGLSPFKFLFQSTAVAVDSSGDVYIGLLSPGVVVKFASDGTFISSASLGFFSNNIRGIAFDSSGNVYVSSQVPFPHLNGKITKFTSFPTGSSTIVTGLDHASKIAFDNSNNLYVVEAGVSSTGKILKFDVSGTLLDTFDSGIPSFGTAVAVDSLDNVYYGSAGTIFKFTSFPTGQSTILTGLIGNQGMAIDTTDHLYVPFDLTINKYALASIPEIEKSRVSGPEQIGIYLSQPTQYVYTIEYSGPAALVKDTVPAEFEVISLVATDGTADDFKPGKGPKSQSSTKIEWLVPAGTNTLTVTIDTVESKSKGKVDGQRVTVFKPTSCGPLPINDGATAFEVDEEGNLVLVEVVDPDTNEVTLEPVVIVGPSNSLEVEAVAGAKSCND